LDTHFLWQEKMMKLARRSFNREFKMSVCAEVIAGRLKKTQACRQHGLSPGLLDRWVDQYKVLGQSAFPNGGEIGLDSCHATDAQRVKDLEALVGRLVLENDFLKAAVKKGLGPQEKKPR
jgi:transposase-like protein